jgi:hypothetical protein
MLVSDLSFPGNRRSGEHCWEINQIIDIVIARTRTPFVLHNADGVLFLYVMTVNLMIAVLSGGVIS